MTASSDGLPFDESQLLQLLVKSVVDYAIYVISPEGHVLTWNEGAQKLKGYTADEIRNKHFSIFYTAEDLAHQKPELELKVAAKQGKYEEEGWRVRKDGSLFWAHVTITRMLDDNQKLIGFAKVTHDLSDRERFARRERLIRDIAVLSATTDNFNDLLREVVTVIGRFLNWQVGHAYIWNATQQTLQSADAWYLQRNSKQFKTFVKASESLRFEPGVGLPGRVYESQTVLLLPDLANDPSFLRQAVIQEANLHAGVGIPLKENGRVFAVLEFFSEGTISNASNILDLAELVSLQVSRFLERQRITEEQESFFNASHDLLCWAGFDGYFKKVSPSWTKILGYTEEEVLADPYPYFIHPEDLGPSLEAGRAQVEKGEIVTMDIRFRHKDGSYRWLQWYSVPIFDRQMIYAIGRDITEEKEKEKQLQETLSLQNAILNGANYGIISVGLDGVVKAFNAGAERMFGYKAEEFVGKTSPPRLTDPESLAERAADLSRVLGKKAKADAQAFTEIANRGIQEEFEWTYVRKDGTKFPALLSVTALRNESGGLTGYMGIVQDMTARREAERERERLLAIIEQSPDMISFAEEDGTILYQNQGGNRILGYPPDHDFTGSNGRNLIAPSAYEILANSTGPAMQTKGIWQGEFALLREDGSEIPVSLVIFQLPTKEGEPRLVASIARNISDVKEASKKLEQTLALRNAVLNSSAYGIICFDLNGVVTVFNHGAEQLMGYSAEEFIGKSDPPRLTDPLTFDERAEDFSRVVGRPVQADIPGLIAVASLGIEREFDWTYIRKDGTRFPGLLTVTALRDEQGNMTGYMSMIRDITARREAEIARERLLAIVEKSPDLIGFADEHGQVIFQNAGGNRMLGYPEDHDQSTMTVRDYHPKWVFDLAETEISKALQEHGYWQGETALLHRDGTEIPSSQVVFLLPSKKGETLYIATIARDITEYKKAEAKLAQQAKDLRISNQELEQFAYVASHDLQEPLRMVCSFLGLLEIEFKDQLTEEAQEYINYAVDGGMRMRALIDGLLDFSRVGRQSVELVPISMEAILGEVLINLQVATSDAQATITNDPLPMVQGDRISLIRLLQNLISNSLKFRTDEPVNIHIGAKPIEDGEVLFTVRDNGIGIDAKHQEKIFMIFQRLHPKSKYPGSGIGLSICRKIVERHGGRLWLDTETKEGTQFFFTLKSQ